MDYYEILGVAREATPQEIKKAFRQIARECHPDVTGEDPVAAERFKTARKAYETLIDPVTRSRYDRRGQRRGMPKGGSFFDAFYRHTAGSADPDMGGPSPGTAGRDRTRTYGAHDAGGTVGAGRKAKHNPGNDLDLEDLFKDFGDFGFGGAGGKGPSATRGPSSSAPPPRAQAPETGADVEIEINVNAQIAREGGTVTAVYSRLQRAASWRPGAGDAGVVRIQDIADIRIIPGTRDGEVLKEKGLGDAGSFGGSYGDLIVRVRVVGGRARTGPRHEDTGGFDPPTQEEERPRHDGHARTEAPPPREERGTPVTPDANGVATVDISIAEALLGGRVPLDTPQGRVRIAIPPGTSSGTRMRLKAKGSDGGDLFIAIRIVVPKELDDESRKLVEEFARLNPGTPRD